IDDTDLLINGLPSGCNLFLFSRQFSDKFGGPFALRKYRKQLHNKIGKDFLMAGPIKDRNSAPLPAPNSSFYDLIETLTAENLTVMKQVHTFMEAKSAPII